MTIAENELNLTGRSRVHSTVRFDLYDRDGSRIGEVHPDRDSAEVSWDSSGKVSRRLRGVALRPDEADDVDPFRHRLRPVWVLSSGDEFPVGQFAFEDASYAHSTRGRSLTSTLLDESDLLDEPMATSVGFHVGHQVDRAIVELLDRLGVADRLIESSSATLGEAMVWPAGRGTWLRALEELHAVGGYLPPWFDNSGTYQARPSAPVGDLASAIRFSDHEGSAAFRRVAADSVQRIPTPLSAPNVYIVTGGVGTPIVGRYDLPASAPNSAFNQGREVVRAEQLQGIGSTWAANTRARTLATTDPDQAGRLSFASTPEPRLDGYDVCEYNGLPHRSVSWSLPLRAGGTMGHEMIRLYP